MGLREFILVAIALLAVYVGYQLYRASRVPKAPVSPDASADRPAGEVPASVELPAETSAGVDALATHFPGARPIPGVRDNGDPSARAVPTFGLSASEPQPIGR